MQLTVKEAAKELNVAEKTVYRWIQSGGLPAYRVAGEYRINRAMLFDWAGSRKAPSGTAEPAAEPDPNAMPALSAALAAGGIRHGLPGATKPDVLKAAVAALDLPGNINRDFLLQALLMREQLQSTGIGDGVAIPHVRNPAVLGLAAPQVSLFFLAEPVGFDALDGKPVHALFIPLSPSVRVHLHLLGKIAFALRDPRIKELVARAADADTLMEAFRALEAPAAD
jgi:PTS system nitrogen regulatory IIA component